jgi:hypothetical protein
LYIITAGLLISASTLAKPSFIICFIPAILAYMVVRFLRKEAMDLRLLTFGLFVPAILVLGWQFLINYGGTESQILLMPFAVKSYYSDHLLIKFVFSAFFPTLVLISYLKELIEDPKMVVSWALFAVGSFYSYFLAENSGGGIYHGNFDWSAEISLFLLFATSMIFFFEVKQHHQSIQIKDYIIMGALLLHLASGILFLVFNLTVDSYSYLPSIQRLLWPFLN